MKTIINHKTIKHIEHTSTDGSITWIHPLRLYVGICNPFKTKYVSQPWFRIYKPKNGFHFLGFIVHWRQGAEIPEKRIVHK